jgi:hypothetical protein
VSEQQQQRGGFEVLKAIKDANAETRAEEFKRTLDDGLIEKVPGDLWRALGPG